MTETLAPADPAKLIIDGQAVDAVSGRTSVTTHPATEQPICAVGEAGPEDVDRAVQAARRAFDDGPWPRMKAAQKAIAALQKSAGPPMGPPPFPNLCPENCQPDTRLARALSHHVKTLPFEAAVQIRIKSSC